MSQDGRWKMEDHFITIEKGWLTQCQIVGPNWPLHLPKSANLHTWAKIKVPFFPFRGFPKNLFDKHYYWHYNLVFKAGLPQVFRVSIPQNSDKYLYDWYLKLQSRWIHLDGEVYYFNSQNPQEILAISVMIHPSVSCIIGKFLAMVSSLEAKLATWTCGFCCIIYIQIILMFFFDEIVKNHNRPLYLSKK